MTDRKPLLLSILQSRVGPERAVTARTLAAQVDLSEREVRALLQELVVEDGYGEILSSVRNPAGYYWASCLADTERYMATLKSRAVEVLRRRRAVRLAMRRLPTRRPVQPALFGEREEAR